MHQTSGFYFNLMRRFDQRQFGIFVSLNRLFVRFFCALPLQNKSAKAEICFLCLSLHRWTGEPAAPLTVLTQLQLQHVIINNKLSWSLTNKLNSWNIAVIIIIWGTLRPVCVTRNPQPYSLRNIKPNFWRLFGRAGNGPIICFPARPAYSVRINTKGQILLFSGVFVNIN